MCGHFHALGPFSSSLFFPLVVPAYLILIGCIQLGLIKLCVLSLIYVLAVDDLPLSLFRLPEAPALATGLCCFL